ncbi:MAG: diaminopimelate epimerase [Candidatus Cryptobacteroides sp.]
MRFHKYHGAGNDFLIADGRGTNLELDADLIAALCDRHTGFGADGVMVLEDSGDHDFRMRYYNSDGSGGMMCGNGGRCIVAFAADLGFTHFSFEAPDGPHEAELVGTEAGIPEMSCCKAFSHKPRIVRLKMKDVDGAVAWPRPGDGASPAGPDDWFLDTGTRHLVRFVDNIESQDVTGEGAILRHDPRFAPVGVNVNFVKIESPYCSGENDAAISVRTFEKGVEDETLACGTGIVASALAAWIAGCGGNSSAAVGMSPDGIPACREHSGSRPEVSCGVRARIADLCVSFRPSLTSDGHFSASDVFLTGPAVFVGIVDTEA